jgi:hypothetical protein
MSHSSIKYYIKPIFVFICLFLVGFVFIFILNKKIRFDNFLCIIYIRIKKLIHIYDYFKKSYHKFKIVEYQQK